MMHLLLSAEDVGVAGIDAEARHTEVFTTGSSKVNVVASVVMHAALRQHGVVLQLGLTQRRAVVADDHKLGSASAESLEGGLVAQRVLARLDHPIQTRVDGLLSLLCLLCGHHC